MSTKACTTKNSIDTELNYKDKVLCRTTEVKWPCCIDGLSLVWLQEGHVAHRYIALGYIIHVDWVCRKQIVDGQAIER